MMSVFLFGGACGIQLPLGYIDASLFRQIPDNQEVYIEKDSDSSFIIEILETPEDKVALSQGVRYNSI